MGIPFTIIEESTITVLLLFFIYCFITKPEVLPVLIRSELPEEEDIQEEKIQEKRGREIYKIKFAR